MTGREAAELLVLLRGTWAKIAPDEVANRLWLDDLANLDAGLASETFRNLRDDWADSRPPAWANFLTLYRQKAKLRNDARPAIAEHGAPSEATAADRERLHEMTTGLKERLQLAGSRKQGTPRAPRSGDNPGGTDERH